MSVHFPVLLCFHVSLSHGGQRVSTESSPVSWWRRTEKATTLGHGRVAGLAAVCTVSKLVTRNVLAHSRIQSLQLCLTVSFWQWWL